MKRRNLLRGISLACTLHPQQTQTERLPLLAPPPGIPQPKFNLYQRVFLWSYRADETFDFLESGHIFGVVWKPDDFIVPVGWCYWLQIEDAGWGQYWYMAAEEQLLASEAEAIADHDSVTVIR